MLAPKLVALKAALPAPLVVGAVALADGALSAGFAAYTLADLKMVSARTSTAIRPIIRTNLVVRMNFIIYVSLCK